MSLLRTLATVAAGVALAKGASAMAGRAREGSAGRAPGGSGGGGILDALQQARRGGGTHTGSGRSTGLEGLGELLGGGPRAGQSAGGTRAGQTGGGGLGDILESLGVDAGGAGSASGSGGGLGSILESLTGAGGGAGRGSGGPIGDLGSLLGGGAAGGALGQLLGGGQGTQAQARETREKPDFGNRLNEVLRTGQEPEKAPTVEEEAVAGLMIRAMLMAAKSDGRIDAGEREKLLDTLQDAAPEERAFVDEQLAAPVDPASLARDVPDHPGLRRQVYATALMAIDLDSRAEAQFMGQLAQALGLGRSDLEGIHRKMGGTPFG